MSTVEAEGSFFSWRANFPAPSHHGVFAGHVRRYKRNFGGALRRRRWPVRRQRDAEWALDSVNATLNTSGNARDIYVGASVYRGAETVVRGLVVVQGGVIRAAWGATIFDTWAALHGARKAAGQAHLPGQAGTVLPQIYDIAEDNFPNWDGNGVDHEIMPVAVETPAQGTRQFRLGPFYRHTGDGTFRLEVRANVPQRCADGDVPRGSVRGDRLTCMRRGYRLALKHLREGVVRP